MADRELEGRVAPVTGTGRNIGRAIAPDLADAGAAVVVNVRRSLDEAEAVAAEVRKHGGQASALLAAVADADAMNSTVMAALERFGGSMFWSTTPRCDGKPPPGS